MISSQKEAPIQVNRRGLAEILTFCLLSTLLTVAGWWYWQSHNPAAAALGDAPVERAALGALLLYDNTVILTLALLEFVALLAVILLIVPPAWWIRVAGAHGARTINGQPAAAETPIQWLGQQVETIRTRVTTPQTAAPSEQTMQFNTEGSSQAPSPDQQSGQQPEPAHPGQPQPSQPQADQSQPGPQQPDPANPVQAEPNPQAQPGPQQPNPQAQPQPGQSQPSPAGQENQAEQPGAQPAANDGEPAPVAPKQSLEEALQFVEEEEEDVLADLGDMTSLIASAFDEDEGVDPDLEALAKMLDPVDIEDLSSLSRRVAGAFAGD